MSETEVPVTSAEEFEERLPALLDELRADQRRVIAVGREGRPEAAFVAWRRWSDLTADAPELDDDEAGDLPPSTLEEDVEYEVAEDMIGDMIGWCSAQIARERAKPNPDPIAIDHLKRISGTYATERRELYQADRATLGRISKEYGARLRALRERDA